MISKNINQTKLNNYKVIIDALKATDVYTKGHSDRVSGYSVLIGKKLGLSKLDLENLRVGGLFHDIGKSQISDSILLKNGKLTTEEYSEMKKHPIIGKDILSNAELFEDILPIVMYHHERLDGTGYPYGLTDNQIPLLAKIVSVADAFDAMTSRRSYRDELDLGYVKNELILNSGTQFDPIVTKAFLDILENYYEKIEKIKSSY